MKKIMIIGANWQLIPLIKKAKEMGLYVVATEGKEYPEAFNLADKTYIADPRNLDEVLKIAKENNIDGVVSDQCDYSAFASAYVSEMLKLKGSNVRDLVLTTNKKNMRVKCRDNQNITQPEFYPCLTMNDTENAAKKLGYPLIIKPVDNRGNFGVNRVDSEEELHKAYLEALANSHSREIIVEKFIEGKLLTVEGYFVKKGIYKTLAISWKKMLGGKKRVAMELIYSLDGLEQDIVEKVKQMNLEIVKTLGLDFGLTHTEFILTAEGDIYFVEIANRGGGVHISNKIIPDICGLDIPELLIKNCLDEEINIDLENDYFMKKCSILSFMNFNPGKIIGINGLEEIRNDKRILDFRLMVKIGDTIKEITTDANRHCFVILSDENYEKAQRLLEEVKQKVIPMYEDNKIFKADGN